MLFWLNNILAVRGYIIVVQAVLLFTKATTKLSFVNLGDADFVKDELI